MHVFIMRDVRTSRNRVIPYDGTSVTCERCALRYTPVMKIPPKKNPAAVALAKLRAASMTAEERSESARVAGMVGGPARAAKLTNKQRRDSASKAARARWAKKRTAE
jgi:hypothetical protein